MVSGPHLLPNARRFVNRIRAGILEFKPRLFWTNRGKNWANPDLPDDPSDTQQIVLTGTGSTIYCVKSDSVGISNWSRNRSQTVVLQRFGMMLSASVDSRLQVNILRSEKGCLGALRQEVENLSRGVFCPGAFRGLRTAFAGHCFRSCVCRQCCHVFGNSLLVKVVLEAVVFWGKGVLSRLVPDECCRASGVGCWIEWNCRS